MSRFDRPAGWLLAASMAIPLLSGCVTPMVPTGYVPAPDPAGYGYSETQTADGNLEITFRANEATSLEQATDFALLRSASVALENGCRFFAIVAMEVASTQEAETSSPELRTLSHADQLSGRALRGGPVTDATAPTSLITVSCRDAGDGAAYDADFIRDSVTEKHGLVLADGQDSD